jgi:hypothetical protein
VIDGLAMALRQDYCMSNSMHLQFFLPFHFIFFFARSEWFWLMMLARWTVFGHPRFGLEHWRREESKVTRHCTQLMMMKKNPETKRLECCFHPRTTVLS